MTARGRSRRTSLEEDQINLVVSSGHALRARGFVGGPEDLYPEHAGLRRIGYMRHSANVPLMLLLYDRVVVYVPPTGADRLAERLGITLPTLVDFVEAKLVIPLVGHLDDYEDPIFDHLLAHDPASIWARGLGVLEVLGLQDTLDESRCPLPVADLARAPGIRAWFALKFPGLTSPQLTARIKQEVLTNYADLCIFGETERQIADSLAEHRDATRLVTSLFAINEVRTYPTLFGLGGTANYELSAVTTNSRLFDSMNEHVQLGVQMRIIPPSLPLLLGGLEIDVPNLGVEDVMSFRGSGDAERLRKSIERFERVAANQVGHAPETDTTLFLERAEELQTLLWRVVRDLHDYRGQVRARRAEDDVTIGLRMGGAALGGWFGSQLGATESGVIGGVTAAEILRHVIPVRLRERLINATMIARFGIRTAPLWRIHRRRVG